MVLIAAGLWILGINRLAAAGISYPALGNIHPDEGTIEIWFTPMADLYPSLGEGEYRSVFQLFSLQVPGRFSFAAHWSVKDGRAGMHVSINHATVRDGLYSLPSTISGWTHGRKHHMAMAWRGRSMKSFIDGREVSNREQAAWFEGPVGEARFIVGHREFRETPIVVHAVRVSQVAKAEPELRGASPIPDLFTSLLDRFESESAITDEKITTPEVISSVSGERGGQIKGTFHFVKGPTPGVAMFARGKEQEK